MLRTFDDLGFRQEQRFHLELGLLKLVHVQRLLPVEDLLSQLGPAPTATPQATPSVPRPVTMAPSTASASAKPSREVEAAPGSTPVTSAPTQRAFSPAPSPAQPPAFDGSLALAEAPELVPADRPHLVPVPAAALDLEALQSAGVTALAAAKIHQTAADKLADSTWSSTADTLSIQTTVSAAMLPLLFNAEAERILKSTLAAHNVKLRLSILPGASVEQPSRPRSAASAASVDELAANHPVVQQARQLFSAEISNVIDLRGKD